MTSLFQRLAIWAAVIMIIIVIVLSFVNGFSYTLNSHAMSTFYKVMGIIIFCLSFIAIILGYTEKKKN